MKLMSYVTPQRASFGVVQGERVVDLGLRFGAACPDLKSAIAQGLLPRIAALVDNAPADFLLDEVVALPVIPNPARILCVGLNYVAHRAEGQHKTEAAAPTIFLRLPESQVGHGRPLVCPRESDQFDFEAELAVVIGKAGRRIAKANALSHIAGISAYNDGSVRDWQLLMGQWSPGKNFPATGAFGPWMVTSDEVPPDRVLSLVCRLNGQEMQRTTTDLMMFGIPELISHLSTFTTLEPGDVIVTGTPGGVGLRRTPPVWMKHGDVVEIELEGVGILRNPVVKEGVAR
jgi:2-keto-4-pentenoate hydratase/2-oxohepta-3-ene-1,7-dioic acid hydratase in catechol pathway